MSRRMWAGVAGWLAAVVAATVAGVGAVTVAGADLSGPSMRPLSEGEVRKALEETGRPTHPGPTSGVTGAPPSPAGPTPSTDDGVTKVFTSPGGSVLARCVGDQAILDWWTPQQGYQVDDVERGPGREVSVEFESATREVELEITCRGGVPQVHIDD